jgi:hypothetical protein
MGLYFKVRAERKGRLVRLLYVNVKSLLNYPKSINLTWYQSKGFEFELSLFALISYIKSPLILKI